MNVCATNSITSPLRVLQITSTSLMGGAEQMVLQLARYADPKRLHLEILSLMGPGHLTDRARALGIKAENWGLDSLRDPRLLGRMKRFLEEGKYDLVHCYGLRAELLTRGAARKLGVALISSISSPDPWRKRHHVWLDRATARGVTLWVAVCQAARKTRLDREKFPPERVLVVYNGIPDCAPPTAEQRRAARAKLGVSDGARVLAVVGNLRAAKGYPDLIEALAILKKGFAPDPLRGGEQNSALVCLAAGRDDSQGTIPALAEQRGVAGVIKWLGFVNEMSDVYDAADIVVSASHWEGCPINILEAMRAARPIVATRVGGVPELIEHRRDGLLVEARDPKALADAICTLLRAPAQAEAFASSARGRYERQFTVDKMVDELTRIYDLAVMEKRGL